MSDKIALSTKLPADEEVNGLDSLHEELLANPDQVICVIAWLDVPRVTHDVEAKKDRLTVRMRRVEPIAAVGKVTAEIVKLAQELQQARTGRTPLPFDKLEPNPDHVEIVS